MFRRPAGLQTVSEQICVICKLQCTNGYCYNQSTFLLEQVWNALTLLIDVRNDMVQHMVPTLDISAWANAHGSCVSK